MPMPDKVTIYTLEARGNVLLESLAQHYRLGHKELQKQILDLYSMTRDALLLKGIDYDSLKPALVPNASRYETGFIFDTRSITSGWYGRPVLDLFVPLLDPKATQSVLWGDIQGTNPTMVLPILRQVIRPGPVRLEGIHPSQLFCMYVTNITQTKMQEMHEALAGRVAYVGYIPATHFSHGNAILSTSWLARAFLKHGNTFIVSHPDDVPNTEDENPLGCDFSHLGYAVRSIQEACCGVFLTHKIERPVFDGFESDTFMALTAIAPSVVPLEDCEVLVEDAKHTYLQTEKQGSLKRAALLDATNKELAASIKDRVSASYIYNMTYMPKYNVAKFNLILEYPVKSEVVRLTAVLEYRPSDRVLRVITLY
jgi:hypothetical protein